MKNSLTGSSFVEDWCNVPVQLYIDPNVKMKGDVVGGVRISPKAVKVQQQVTRDNAKLWKGAVTAYKRDGNFNKVLERCSMSNEDMQFIVDEVAAGNV